MIKVTVSLRHKGDNTQENRDTIRSGLRGPNEKRGNKNDYLNHKFIDRETVSFEFKTEKRAKEFQAHLNQYSHIFDVIVYPEKVIEDDGN